MLAFAREMAEGAGRLLMRHLGELRESDVAYKGRVDLVTAADRASEDYIVGAIRARFPDHDILAEERAPDRGAGGHRWVIDPLDGTTNFVHGFPFFCVSIALEVEGRPRVAVVHAPQLGETFEAQAGKGARLNGRRLSVSSVDRLIRSLLATGFAYDRWESSRNNLDEFCRLTMATQGVRRGGSAALDLSYTAAGRLDGFWEFGLKRWDVAAGILLVQEAGGVVTDDEGGTAYADGARIVASNGRIHRALLEALGGGS